MKIVIVEDLGISDEVFNKISKPLADNGHELVLYQDGKLDSETLKERIQDADVIAIANTPLSGEVIDAATNLKYISVAFTGYNHIDLNKCKERGIQVSNAAGYSTDSVAEITFGLIISLLRNIVPLEAVVRQGGTKEGYAQLDLKGKTWALLALAVLAAR